MNYKTKFGITIPSRTEFLKMLVEISTHFSILNGFCEKEAKKISIAIDEAVTNIIKHSYNYDKEKDIKIIFSFNKELINILLEFGGKIPDIEEKEVNIKDFVKNKKKGGLGVNLMKKIMDKIEYYTKNNKNYCEMIKWKKKT